MAEDRRWVTLSQTNNARGLRDDLSEDPTQRPVIGVYRDYFEDHSNEPELERRVRFMHLQEQAMNAPLGSGERARLDQQAAALLRRHGSQFLEQDEVRAFYPGTRRFTTGWQDLRQSSVVGNTGADPEIGRLPQVGGVSSIPANFASAYYENGINVGAVLSSEHLFPRRQGQQPVVHRLLGEHPTLRYARIVSPTHTATPHTSNEFEQSLSSLPASPNLNLLDVSSLGRLDTQILGGLLRSPLMQAGNVRVLNIGMNALLAAEGMQALAGCEPLKTLRELYVPVCMIGDGGVRALTQSPHLRQLEVLNLACNVIHDSGAGHLAGWRNEHLKILNLNVNEIGTSGLRALARSATLNGLEHIRLGAGHFNPDSQPEPGLHNVQPYQMVQALTEAWSQNILSLPALQRISGVSIYDIQLPDQQPPITLGELKNRMLASHNITPPTPTLQPAPPVVQI